MNNPLAVIAIAGPAGSGKDTAGKYLIENFGFKKLSFAGPLKQMLTVMGFPEPATAEEKEAIIPALGVSWRQMAQSLGTEWGREKVHADLWVILAERLMRREGGAFVITDCRFENEAHLTRSLKGVVGHLEGRAYEMPEATAGHRSEAGIEFKEGGNDFHVDNSGTLEELYSQLDTLASYVGAQRVA